MSRKRRVVLLLIISLMFALALYGCGSNDEDDQQNNDPDQQEQNNNDNEDDVDLETAFRDVEFPTNISYVMTIQSEGASSYTSRLWIMDDKMRNEYEMEGMTFISIYDGERFFTLDPSTKIAMRYPIDEELEEDEIEEEPELGDFIDDDDWGSLDYVQEEMLNGVKTYVVLDSFDGLDVEYKMWIHHAYGIPMRVESSGPNPDDNYVLEVSDLKVGEVTDEDFEIPEDYEIMDLGF